MNYLIKKVMEHHDIVAQPPVLIDVGASGSLPEKWKAIAPHSICIAFDADTREFDVKESTGSKYRKLFLLNRLVAANPSPQADFYLTESPYCSSSLKPNNQSLKPWAFHSLFDVKERVQMPSVTLSEALSSCDISYIDWYKTDTQGTDLTIFDALPDHIKNDVIIADFEPGIIDAYIGEDKLYSLMSYMDKRPFWVSSMNVKGSQWIAADDIKNLGMLQKIKIGCFLKTAPGWCEISYMNKLCDPNTSKRAYLLAWVFATLQKEHGFALFLANTGLVKYDDPLFKKLSIASQRSLNSLSGYFSFVYAAFSKVFRMLRDKL